VGSGTIRRSFGSACLGAWRCSVLVWSSLLLLTTRFAAKFRISPRHQPLRTISFAPEKQPPPKKLEQLTRQSQLDQLGAVNKLKLSRKQHLH
jgi:hypothetical protein